MLNLKKTALAVLALGSTAAFAGTMGPVCSAVNVTVPCENTAWDLGGRALYIQPSALPAVGVSNITGNNGSTTTLGANPQWAWGFQLEASYHYNTGNDFNVNWYHFRNDSTYANAGGFSEYYIQPGEKTPETFTVNSANGNVASAWDTVNMEFGQHVDFGENKFARFHAGAAFTRVGYSGATFLDYSTTNNPGYDSTISETYSQVFNGFGPRVGTDLTYDWGNGLSIYGNGALGLLAGTSKSSLTPTVDYYGTSYTSSTSISHTRVVPELDAKLGAMYTYAMAQGDLSLDVGWVWADYINSLTSLDDTTTHDFGIQGLYFGLKWVGSVA